MKEEIMETDELIESIKLGFWLEQVKCLVKWGKSRVETNYFCMFDFGSYFEKLRGQE